MSRLRRELLDVEVPDEAVASWTWPRIEASLREEFGYAPPATEPDTLRSIGEHFFPSLLAEECCGPSPRTRKYRVHLANTVAAMWNTGAGREKTGGTLCSVGFRGAGCKGGAHLA